MRNSTKQEIQNITGIVNGDLSQDRTDEWGKVGWEIGGFAGKGPGFITLYHFEHGSTLRQNIVVGKNQGISIEIKAKNVQVEVRFQNHILFSNTYTSETDWIRQYVPFGDLVSYGELSFYVLPGIQSREEYAGFRSITLYELK